VLGWIVNIVVSLVAAFLIAPLGGDMRSATAGQHSVWRAEEV
jgi:hypothetical protein